MNSLVLQLQKAALDSNTKIADLLRKAKVVAVKLDLTDKTAWIESELNGYEHADDIPDYRRIGGRIVWHNPYHGWRPVIFLDEELEQAASQITISESAASLEEAIGNCKQRGVSLCIPIPGHAQAHLAKATGESTEYQVQLSHIEVANILEMVRNEILDWALDLEKMGILGADMIFSLKEKEEAKNVMSSGNVYNIQNLGVLGNVAQSSVTTHQSAAYTKDQLSEIRSAIEQISHFLAQLPNDIRAITESSLNVILTELEKPTPNSKNLQTVLASIHTTCEGAAGNLIASGICELIAKFL